MYTACVVYFLIMIITIWLKLAYLSLVEGFVLAGFVARGFVRHSAAKHSHVLRHHFPCQPLNYRIYVTFSWWRYLLAVRLHASPITRY